KAVDGVEQRRQRRTLLGQVVLRATAEDQHIDLLLEPLDIVQRMNRYARIQQFDTGWIASGEDADQLHIRALGNGHLHATSKIAVAGDTNSDFRLHGKPVVSVSHKAVHYTDSRQQARGDSQGVAVAVTVASLLVGVKHHADSGDQGLARRQHPNTALPKLQQPVAMHLLQLGPAVCEVHEELDIEAFFDVLEAQAELTHQLLYHCPTQPVISTALEPCAQRQPTLGQTLLILQHIAGVAAAQVTHLTDGAQT